MPERPVVATSGLREAVAGGDDRVALESVRDALAGSMEMAAPNEMAALSKQLVDVLARIAALPAQKVSAVDDIANQRARRKAVAPDSSSGGKQRRTGGDGSSS
jgi:hypothetical protein